MPTQRPVSQDITPIPPARPAPAASTRGPQLAGAGLSSVGSLAGVLVGAPWQAIVLIALAGLATVALQSVLQAVMPQDSADRLTWWTNRRTHYTRRQRQALQERPQRPG